MGNTTTINGEGFDVSSVILELNGDEYSTGDNIDWASELKPGELRGSRAKIQKRSRGEASHSLSFELERGEGDSYVAKLGAAWGTKRHTNTLRFKPADDAVESKVEFVDCRIVKKNPSAKGSGVVVTKFEIHCMDILENGVSIVD